MNQRVVVMVKYDGDPEVLQAEIEDFRDRLRHSDANAEVFVGERLPNLRPVK